MEIIESISLLCEMLAFLTVMYTLMEKQLKIDIYLMFFLALDIFMYRLIGREIYPDFVQVIVYIALFIYLKVHFHGEKSFRVIAAIASSYFLVSGMQVIAYLFSSVILGKRFRICIINIVIYLAVLILFHFGRVWEKGILSMKNNKVLIFILIFCGGLFSLLAMLSKAIGLSFLNCLLIAIIVLTVLAFCQQWKAERDKNVLKEREIRMLQQYNDSFEHLLQDVRARQHEFDNQIHAIYSLQYVCESFEELVEKQNEYAKHIIKKNQFNNLLTLSCSSGIKGFLYYKFCVANEKGIDIHYEIELPKLEKMSVEFDIQEILGILFDNACEALDIADEKEIIVSVMNREDNVYIHMENPAAYISQKVIQKYTKQGYSSKGKNRGYGLSNVKQIAAKYDGELAIENRNKTGQNWLSISVLLKNISKKA